MEEIALLQQKLHQIQSLDLRNRINERVTVDLVNKIQEKFSLNLILNSEATEFFTFEYLYTSIQEEIRTHSRLKKIEICQIFKVNIEKIESILAKILESTNEILRYGEVYVTKLYFHQIADEIDEELSKHSTLFISDLSLHYEIPVYELKLLIAEWIARAQIHGILTQDKLLSKDFLKTLSAKIKGILKGSFFPLNLIHLKERLQFGKQETHWVLQRVIEELIEKGELDGKIIDGKYFHESFVKNRKAAILEIFQNNNFIEYQMLKEFYVDSPEMFLRSILKEEIGFFENYAISAAFLLNLKENLIESLDSENYVFMEKLLPLQLTEKDCDELIGPKYFDLSVSKISHSQGYFFKSSQIDSILSPLQERLRKVNPKTRKNIKKIISNEVIEKEIEKHNVYYENEVKTALISLLYSRLENFSEFYQENEVRHSDLSLEKLSHKTKNALESFKDTYNYYKNAISAQSQMNNPGNNESLNEKIFNQGINLIEITIFFNLKRFSVEIPQNFLFIDQISEINFFSDYFQIFKNRDSAEKCIELLPEKVGKLLVEAENLILDEEFQNFAEFIERKEEEIYGEEIGEELKEKGEYRSPQKQKNRKLQHKKSRSNFC